MAKSKLDALNELSTNISGIQSKAAKKLEDARNVQNANMLKGAAASSQGTGMSTGQVAQAMAPQNVQAQAQVQQSAIATGVSLGMAEGQQRLKQQEQTYQQTLTTVQKEKEQILDSRRSALDAIGKGVTKQLFDEQMDFKKDELGRTMFNERQLRDAAIMTARTENEAQDRLQTMQQHSQTKIDIMTAAVNKLNTAVSRGWLVRQNELDFDHRKKLAKIAKEMQDKINKEKNKSANRGAFMGAAITTLAAFPPYGTAAAVGLTVAQQTGVTDKIFDATGVI